MTSLARTCAAVLDDVLRGVSRAALLDFPDHPNVGDSAIWLGTVAYLRGAGIRRAPYTCHAERFLADALARALDPDTVILLQGGGSLGDLWEAPQRMREEVVARFPDHRIVLLPQSMWFRSDDALDRARRAFDAHERLTLLLRDRESLERARAAFRAPALLCPDLALLLEPPAPAPPSRDVVRVLRDDVERKQPGLEPDDWLDEPRSLRRALARRLPPGRLHLAACDALARKRLARGLARLASGRRVVTDRLHGHVLCLLLGRPHVLLDNGYGKIRAFYETWTRDSPLVTWCEDPEEARRFACA